MNEKKKRKDKPPKKFGLPRGKQPIYKFFSKILFRPIFKRNTESMIKNLPKKAIIVSNHARKTGPMAVAMSYPRPFVMWGHHAMLGSYRERFSYLRNVFYIEALHQNKFIATLKASYEAFFSIFIYKGIKVIGTYRDMRFASTIRSSMDVLNKDESIIIFPENSSDGYFDEMTEAYQGFIGLSELYYKRFGEDVPIIPIYISNKKKRLIIGKPRYVHEMQTEGLTKKSIAERLKEDINLIHRKYIETGKKIKECIESAEARGREYYNEILSAR